MMSSAEGWDGSVVALFSRWPRSLFRPARRWDYLDWAVVECSQGGNWLPVMGNRRTRAFAEFPEAKWHDVKRDPWVHVLHDIQDSIFGLTKEFSQS
jgi:hypothetical protein